MIPAKIASSLVESALRWDQSTQVDISAFLHRYTLHDSIWIGLHTDCAWQDSSIAAVRFDPVWNPSVSAPTPFVADWPLLFIRFNCVTSIHLAGFSNIDGTQRGIASANANSLSEEEIATTITDHYGGSVRIHHFPLIEVLAFDKDGLVLKLSVEND